MLRHPINTANNYPFPLHHKMSQTHTLPLLLFLILTLSFSPSLSCNNQDRTALLAFKNSFTYTTLPWPQPSDCCAWRFVQCDPSNNRVTSLIFSNDNSMPPSLFLNGSIPSSVSNLPFLKTLRFQRIPSLHGPIPPHLAKLNKLESLEIYVTSVSGSVPSFLSQITSLKELALGYNRLSGTLPSSLGSLPSLASLSVYGSDVTGPIPASLFGKLPKGTLATLVLSGNKLTGAVPKTLGNIAFSGIYLQENNLTGDALFLFGRDKTVTTMSLNNNELEFDFGKAELPLGADYIDISHNRIYGRIPEEVVELKNLSYLDASYNQLCGKIPSGGKFGVDAYKNNKCLCGAPLQPCK